MSTLLSLSQAANLGLEAGITVEPGIGLSLFLVGTILSQAYSQILLEVDAHYTRPTMIAEVGTEWHIAAEGVPKKTVAEEVTPPPSPKSGLEEALLDASNAEKAASEKEKTAVALVSISAFLDKGLFRESMFDLVRLSPAPARLPPSGTPLFVRHVPRSLCGALVRSLMLILLVASTYGIMQAIISTQVRYDLGGLVADFLTFDEKHIINNTWDIWTKMPHRTNEKANAWFCAMVFLLTVCLMPLVTAALCLIIWFVPCDYAWHRRASRLLLPCMSWSAMDVYCVATIAASRELHMVANWIINQKFAVCAKGNALYEITGQTCFTVTGFIVWPCYVMILSVLAFWVVLVYTVRQYNAAQRNRELALHN